jgi:hypothetical protein
MTRPFSSRLRIKSDYVAAIAVGLAPLAFFFPAVRGRIILSPDDGVIFNVPLRVAAANLIRSGYLPLWNPYIFCGMPLHGASQAGLLFPLNWFYLISSPPIATNLMMLSTYVLAALGAYFYARRAGANIAGAIATSLIWQWSAFMVEQVGHTNILHTAATLPWVLWAIEGYASTGERRRGLLLAALVALQVFAGHQQTFAYSLLLAGAYAVVMARASGTARPLYYWSLAFLAAGLALAAVQILPTLELLRNSLRATASYDFFSSFSMPPRFALTFFAPYLLGGGNGLLFRAPYIGQPFFGEYVGYVGLLSIMLALVAVFVKPDIRTRFWAVVAVVCLALAFGRFLPLHIYALVYYVPVLNLFRVPARHLMEVEFALAVLAGKGLTVLASKRTNGKLLSGNAVMRVAVFAGVAVLLLTCLTVTIWRPAAFHLARRAPVSVLRAPELFVPVLMAVLSAAVLWWFAQSARRGALVLLLAVLVLDLIVYGQGSGWRTNSPRRDSDLWLEPDTVKFLRDHNGQVEGTYRILTEDQRFDPNLPVPQSPSPGDWALSLQPDVYMMHGIENAAGYDGFGLARYSRLAGDMKVWGELTNPERTLRSDSRELDLLNVRYLLTRPMTNPAHHVADTPSVPIDKADFPEATQEIGGLHFAAEDLGLPSISGDARLTFAIPPVEVNRVALLTNLSWSVDVPDGTVVARVLLRAQDGKTYDFDLRAGEHTSEWAYDRKDISAQIKHRRAPVATSYVVDDAQGRYEAHTYVSSFILPEKAVVTGGEITPVRLPHAPDLILAVFRLSLMDEATGKAFPLRREWFNKELLAPKQVSPSGRPGSLNPPAKDQSSGGAQVENTAPRWRPLEQLGNVAIFENARSLPRAWLATETQVLSEPQMLEVIRTGKFLDGRVWEPRRVALLEGPLDFKTNAADDAASAEVTSHEPNRVKVKTSSAAAAILVLSENHYPGWRAYVDDQRVDVLRVDHNLRGVMLPAGEHRVSFTYRPKSGMIGLTISILALAALILWSRRVLPEEAARRFLRRAFRWK